MHAMLVFADANWPEPGPKACRIHTALKCRKCVRLRAPVVLSTPANAA